MGTIPEATAAADPPLEPPGVRLVSHGLRVTPNRADSHVGSVPNSGVFVLPRNTRPGPPQSHGQLLIVARDVVAQEARSLREPHPLPFDGEVLEQVGDAGEWPAGQATVNRIERPLELAGDDGVEQWIEPFDPRDRRLDQFDRRDLAPAHQLRLPHRVQPRELVDRRCHLDAHVALLSPLGAMRVHAE